MASEKRRESEGKIRENEKEREKLKASRPKNFINDRAPFTVSRLGSFIDNTQYKITKRSKQALLQWGKIGETNKR